MSMRCEVSDHALLRWLERVCDFPIEAYRTQLAAHLACVASSGASSYRTTEATYVFRAGTLVTVLPAGATTGVDAKARHEARRQAWVR